MSWLYFWTVSLASFRPVSAIKDTVAWKRFACLKISSVSVTPSLRSWSSIPSRAVSMFNQKLISWVAVPESASLCILVIDCIDLIQLFTVDWRLFRKVVSFRSVEGMYSKVALVDLATASSTAAWTTACSANESSGISTFC